MNGDEEHHAVHYIRSNIGNISEFILMSLIFNFDFKDNWLFRFDDIDF